MGKFFPSSVDFKAVFGVPAVLGYIYLWLRVFSKFTLIQSTFQRWVQAFHIVDMEVAVNTNNGVERQNEALKYEYLVGLKNCSLSEMLTVVVENFLPDSYLK